MPVPERGEGGGWTGTGVGIGWAQAVGGDGDVAGRPCENDDEISCINEKRPFQIYACARRHASTAATNDLTAHAAHVQLSPQATTPTGNISKGRQILEGTVFIFRLLLFGTFLASRNYRTLFGLKITNAVLSSMSVGHSVPPHQHSPASALQGPGCVLFGTDLTPPLILQRESIAGFSYHLIITLLSNHTSARPSSPSLPLRFRRTAQRLNRLPCNGAAHEAAHNVRACNAS
jgi:hypothetical protein